MIYIVLKNDKNMKRKFKNGGKFYSRNDLILIIFVNNLVSMIFLINTIGNLGVMIAATQ